MSLNEISHPNDYILYVSQLKAKDVLPVNPSDILAIGATGSNVYIEGAPYHYSSGDVSFASFGSAPNASGAVVTNNQITLEPASVAYPGGVSTTTQSFAGTKTFQDSIRVGATPSVGVGNLFNTYYLQNIGTVNVTGGVVGSFTMVAQCVGAVATLMFSEFTNASSAGGFAVITQALAPEFRPATVGGRKTTIPIFAFGVYGVGSLTVSTAGVISIGIGYDTNADPVVFGVGAGTCGWPDCTVSYSTV